MAKTKTMPLAKMDPAARQARIAKLVANPATRSAVPAKYLPAKYRQQREMNVRLNAPVVQGSSLTNREVAHQAQQAGQVKYGDALRQGAQTVDQQQQLGRDMSHWFDDYRAATQQALGNTTQIGADTTQKVGNLAGAFAAPNTAGFSAENADDATKAAAVRKAILGNLGAVQAAQAGNANQYANTLANVVVPTQKLQAQAGQAGKVQAARDALQGLLKERGSFEQQTRSDIASGEQKNVLSLQVLGLDAQKAAADQAAGRATRRETRRANQTSETLRAAEIDSSAKSRYGPGGTAMNKFGYTYDEWTKLSPSQQANARKGKGTKANNGVNWVSPKDQSKAQTTIDSAISYAKSLKGKYSRAEAVNALTSTQKDQPLFKTVKDKKTGKTRQERVLNPDGTQATTGGWSAIDSAYASAALDMAYNVPPHLSSYTVKKLHAAGIKVNALGYPTSSRPVAKARLSPAERAPGGT